MSGYVTYEELGLMPEIAIVGSDGMARVIAACHLRQSGYTVHCELQERKASKAHKAAQAAAWQVIDIGKRDGIKSLSRALRRQRH